MVHVKLNVASQVQECGAFPSPSSATNPISSAPARATTPVTVAAVAVHRAVAAIARATASTAPWAISARGVSPSWRRRR